MEELPHPHDVGVVELGQGARLARELLLAVPEQVAVLPGMGRDARPVPGPPGQIPGQIFLDGNPGLQVEIPIQLGDPEAARLAEHTPDDDLPIDPGAVGQQERAALGPFVVSAVGAGVGRILMGEAARAEGIEGRVHVAGGS